MHDSGRDSKNEDGRPQVQADAICVYYALAGTLV